MSRANDVRRIRSQICIAPPRQTSSAIVRAQIAIRADIGSTAYDEHGGRSSRVGSKSTRAMIGDIVKLADESKAIIRRRIHRP